MHPLLRSIPYFLFFVFYWVAEALFVPYLGLYFELRGMNSVQIGMLNGLFYVVTIVSAMTIGYFADKTRRPRHAGKGEWATGNGKKGDSYLCRF